MLLVNLYFKPPRLNTKKGLTPVKQLIRFNRAGRAGGETRNIFWNGFDLNILILDRIYMIHKDYVFFLPHFPEENEETKSAYRRKKIHPPKVPNSYNSITTMDE